MEGVLGSGRGHTGGLSSLQLIRPLSEGSRISSASARAEFPILLEPPSLLHLSPLISVSFSGSLGGFMEKAVCAEISEILVN